jgi:S-methylmethionine-dependent homocysteine/selenocysteine methylase
MTVVILDGGLSTALEELGADLSSSLWTARLLIDSPDTVADAHRAYFAAGARIATTASYQASVPSLVGAGLGEADARRVLAESVAVAARARDEALADRAVTGPLLVAASIGPYGAVLADGSEYRGRYGLSAAELRDFHAPRLELLAAAGPDLLAVETVPDVDEAEVLVPLLEGIGLPYWFSYSVQGGTTRAGQPLADAYAVLTGGRAMLAAGVNCSDPADVHEAVGTAVAVTGKPAVAYPNKGGGWDAATRTWHDTEVLDLELVDTWVAAGARYVGGCCGIGPAQIAGLAARLATSDASS